MPVRISYDRPTGWDLAPLQPDAGWAVLSQDTSGILIVPLALDTLGLPALVATSDGDSILIEPPVVTVERTMPDTLYQVAAFPAPLFMDIPPGLPSDYLEPLEFWNTWRERPRGFPWLPVAIGLLVTGAVLWLIVRRRKHTEAAPAAGFPGPDNSLAVRILSLLECPFMASGDFQALYREIDLLLRLLVSVRSGRDVSAMTHGQIRRALEAAGQFEEMLADTHDLFREIGFQRYAGWGTTRDRAQADIKKLASLARRERG